MYWQKDIETMPVSALQALQLQRLKEVVQRASASSYYQQLFQNHGVTVEELRTLDDIRKFPFTTKQDLRNGYPYGFLTVTRDEVVRLHSSSGTTGQATVIFHTSHDIEDWANLMARCMYMSGARKSDVFQNMTGYGMFTGGLGFHYGAERLGVLTVPAGSGNSKRQIRFMKDFSTTLLHIIPSYALHLLSVFEEEGVNPKTDLCLKIVYLGAEPHSEHTRRRIETALGVKAYNSCYYPKCMAPVALECPNNKAYTSEDCYRKLLTLRRNLSHGEEGELVLDNAFWAMPLIRYRTRDSTAAFS